MRVRFALQGRVLDREVAYPGARLLVVLEPPIHHRPTGTDYGQFVTREYRAARRNREGVIYYVGCLEYWESPPGRMYETY